MTDNGIITAAAILALGLTMNGCAGGPNRGINAYNIIDEHVIKDALVESACILDGREWKSYKCE